MKKIYLTIIMFVCIFIVNGCKRNQSVSDNNTYNNTSNNTSEKETIKSVSTNNSDIELLSNSLDKVKPLSELIKNEINDSISDNNHHINESQKYDGYTDVTEPDNWYFVQSTSGAPGCFYAYSTFFLVFNNYYQRAKSAKNSILENNIPYINAWFSDKNAKIRVLYDEETNDLFLEKIWFRNAHTLYQKVNIGLNEFNKLHYYYLYSEFDNLNIHSGLVEQSKIEYLEDSYYNSFEIKRGISGVISENSKIDFYQFDFTFYDVDLTVDGGLFYTFSTQEWYEINTLEQYNHNSKPFSECSEDEKESLSIIYSFWKEQNNLVEFRVTNTFSALSMYSNVGNTIFDIDYNSGDSKSSNMYSGILNLYEMTNISKIYEKINTSYKEHFPGQIVCEKTAEYIVEYTNGKTMTSDGYDYHYKNDDNYNFTIRYWGIASVDFTHYYPMLQFRNLISLQELEYKLNELNSSFMNFNLEKYINIFMNNTLMIDGMKLNSQNCTIITNHFLSKRFIVDINELLKEPENIEDIKIPYNNTISYSIDGIAYIHNDYIDLSNVTFTIFNSDLLNKKDFKKIDLYYCDVKIKKIEYEEIDWIFKFNTLNKIDLEKNKYSKNDHLMLYIKISKLGIKIEIPFVIINE